MQNILSRWQASFLICCKNIMVLGSVSVCFFVLAAILHDCGKFISMSAPGECAYQIIMSTEILGISHMEREMVAWHCPLQHNGASKFQ